ncbi:MAG TPA: response regulator, partial [Tichowtungia sp.]|nr:response regulator [Tichowtungia sp.]
YKDINGRMLGANETCYRHHGFSSESEIIGKTDLELYPGEEGESGFAAEQSMMESGTTSRGREKIVRKDGRTLYLESIKSPMRDPTGNIIGLAGISRDVTDQVKHEEELVQARQEAEQSASFIRAMFDNLEDLFFYKDRQSRVLGGNKAWLAVHGASSIDDLIGKTDKELLSGALGEQLYENEQQQMAAGKVTRIRERYVKENGDVQFLESVKCPMKNERGDVIGLAGISRDITRQVENEKELMAARMEAEEANKAKSSFLAMMSHEIRTPMNGVIGAASLLQGTELNELQNEFVRTIQVSGDNLLAIINDILDYSKIEAGKIDLESIPFNLRECIEDAFDLFVHAAAKKNLELLCHIEPDVPAGLCGDPTRLRQILVNLIGNAVKFTEKGEVRVEVSVASGRDEAGTACPLVFSVHDTGVGIPDDAQSRLFKSFTQADASSTRKYGGTGLGLAICQRLVELMNGTIQVESEEGKGSCFRFTLDLPTATPPQVKAMPVLKEHLDGKRVLIVDDNETNCRILAAQMEQWQAIPQVLSHPEPVLGHLKESPPYDIMILDFNMPLMTGAQLAEAIRTLPGYSSVPIIILSSSFESIPPSSAISCRMTKPVKMNKLQKQMLLLINQYLQPEGSRVSFRKSDRKMSLRVLVAEDNLINQRVAQMMLQRIGCRKTTFVEDGQAAVDAVVRDDYDVVLMDVQMPHLNGLEAAKKIRQHTGKKEKPWIIAITAGVMDDERRKIIRSGMNDFLAKPLSVDQLEEKLLAVDQTMSQP